MAKPPLANILIVDYDGELLQILKFVLEDAGYSVVESKSGEEALEKVASDPVDLVVLDVNLSGMSGLEVARRLRATTPTSRVLIALHTGVEEASVRTEFVDYDLFMPKMDDADALLTKVADLLAKSRPADGSTPTAEPTLTSVPSA